MAHFYHHNHQYLEAHVSQRGYCPNMTGSSPPQQWPTPEQSLVSTIRSAHGEVSDEEQVSLARPSPRSPISQHGVGFPFQNRKEARYLMYYIKDFSSWIDICDPARHFAREVPRRACDDPLLAFSLLAFASRFFCLRSRVDDPCSDTYYSKAIQLLIPALDDPIASIDENILAAIVLLRLNEEMSENDTCTHLLGSTRLLDLASSFAPLGGLGEAASWLLLRQDMFVSLTRSLSPTSTYENYRNSAFFTSSTPEAMANRAVFMCSQVLAYAFRNDTRLDVERWQELNTNVAEWYISAPKESLPYFASLPSDDHRTDGSCFPTCWMTRPQYARLLLSAFDPQLWKPGPDALRKRPEADESIRNFLGLIVGLSISHPDMMTGRFIAHHTLHAFGSWIQDGKQRNEVLEFLQTLRDMSGWKTVPLIARLSRQWTESTT
ncbi:unnamed protein product [Clonostachys rosea]|uniref:Transcription factor domain-containing protein n=1 Tax=Bionectria ochroleuca TaxID=29856 RepID=A0ABY6UNB9_BIOOC|nr:unnamed protein product [Clonostachys rosea]